MPNSYPIEQVFWPDNPTRIIAYPNELKMNDLKRKTFIMEKLKNKINKIIFSILLTGTILSCHTKETVSPIRKNIIDAVFASGHLENLFQYSVNANIEGFVNKIWVTEGDSVRVGQKLFYLSNDVQNSQVINANNNLAYAKNNVSYHSPQIEPLKLQILQARQKMQVDSINYERYSKLIVSKAVSQADADNARIQYQNDVSNLGVLENNLKDLFHTLNLNVKNAEEQVNIQKETNNYYFLKAKSPGIVLSIHKKVGDYMKKGDAIAQIGSGKTIAKLYLAEDDIHRVKLGQKTLISLNSDRNKLLSATITKIYPSFDENDQSFVVDAQFDSNYSNLVNGSQLQANVVIEERKNALVIPSRYIMQGDYILLNSQKKVKIQVGIRTLEYSEVLSGINGSELLALPKAL